jgi:hypothetical protein
MWCCWISPDHNRAQPRGRRDPGRVNFPSCDFQLGNTIGPWDNSEVIDHPDVIVAGNRHLYGRTGQSKKDPNINASRVGNIGVLFVCPRQPKMCSLPTTRHLSKLTVATKMTIGCDLSH